MTSRRRFVRQISALGAAAVSLNGEELSAMSSGSNGPWDTSWLDRLARGRYRAVFNASEIAGGAAMAYASAFFDHFHEAHGTADAETIPVIVFRAMGISMAFNDAIWEKYHFAEQSKLVDPDTKEVARRNIFWRAAASGAEGSPASLERLRERGLIVLACNVATNALAQLLAQRTKGETAVVAAELKANLIPGAILVPSGIYGLIRAQNAGCAFMPGV